MKGASNHVFGAALRSAVGRGLVSALLSAVVLAVLPALPGVHSAPVHLDTVSAASGAWLTHLNAWRASVGLTNLTENTTWSQGDLNHALYMVKNNLVTHYETVGVPYYTAAGDTAAQNSNIQVTSTTATSDDQAIDWWMQAPFHAMGLMDPRLTQTAFGSYRQTKSGWQEGAAVDVIRGNSFTGGKYPVYFPGNGSTEPLRTYDGGEFPDPLSACSAYTVPTGLPVFIEVGGNVATTVGAHSFTGNGVALSNCVIDSNDPAVGSNLVYRGGVILVPKSPLVTGTKYVVAMTVNGKAYTWSFTVGPLAPQLSLTGVSPSAGSTAGGTTVTITGTGFTGGVTGVNFGSTSAASFTVVNDKTLTAVSPAVAAGTLDVTVTTAVGTTPISSSDLYTFGGCTSLTAPATPPSPSIIGTPISFVANAVGCSSPLYEFWVKAPGASSYTLGQTYSGNGTFAWSTAGKAAGVYSFSIWGRDAASTGASGSSSGRWDTYLLGTYTLTAGCSSVGISTLPSAAAMSGTSVQVTASAIGCANPLYEFWVKAPGSSFYTVAQQYGSALLSWDTTGKAAGTYSFSVWARDAASTGISGNASGRWDAYVAATYALTAGCPSVSVSPSPLSPSTSGTTITFTATAAGCSNPRFEFWVQAPGSSLFTLDQGYSNSGVFTWNTAGKAVGTYGFSVWVIETGTAGTSGNSSGRWDAYSYSHFILG